MSCYFRQNGDAEISIPRYIQSTTSGGVTYYDIKVRVNKIEWLVERRYKDFAQLHDKLVEDIAISKSLLPPKKIVGNRQPAFLEQRREQLERYLRELLVYFRIQLPRVLAEFLDFNKYDIVYLLQDLAKLFNESGDALLSAKKEYNFSALEVYAISERLSLPCPPESIENRGIFDFSHVLDFCTQLEVLIVTPVKDHPTFCNDYNTVDVPIGRSNIIPKSLCFNLNAFRNLKKLKFFGLSTENIIEISLLKPTLQTICVHSTTITHINQVLLCDNLHREIDGSNIKNITSYEHSSTLKPPPQQQQQQQQQQQPSNSAQAKNFDTPDWEQIHTLDLSGNLLTQIDASVRTAPHLSQLILEQNRIRAIQHLSHLPQLEVLSLSANLIADCVDWHLELGNLVSLNIAQNRLKKISGLRKLLSLVHLDVSCNLIDDIEEVDHIACLPILESVRLTGNPLSGSVDYRPRVFARFHERASDISLDNERGTQSELDTALVLSALQKSKMRQLGKQ